MTARSSPPHRARPRYHRATSARGPRPLVWLRRTVLLVLVIIAALAALLLDLSPRLPVPDPPSTQDTQNARKLIKAVQGAINSNNSATPVRASNAELESLSRFIHHANRRVISDFIIGPREALAELSLQPRAGTSIYVNVLLASEVRADAPLQVRGSIGLVPLPAWLMTPLVNLASQSVTGARLDALASWQSIEPGSAVTVLMTVPAAANAQLQRWRQARPSPIRTSSMDVYCDMLMALPADDVGGPLGEVLQPLFGSAAQRAALTDASTEALAALAATAHYLRRSQYFWLAGTSATPAVPCQMAGPRPTINGRGDLTDHFILSALAAAVEDAQFGTAVGEWKELHDSREGGSGFSFVDLLADRAGVRLGTAIAGDGALAGQIIARLAGGAALLPEDIAHELPEGLTQAVFETDYRRLDDAAYRQLVAEIDARISALPLYAGTRAPPVRLPPEPAPAASGQP